MVIIFLICKNSYLRLVIRDRKRHMCAKIVLRCETTTHFAISEMSIS